MDSPRMNKSGVQLSGYERIKADDIMNELMTRDLNRIATPVPNGMLMAQRRVRYLKCFVLVTFVTHENINLDVYLDREFTKYYPLCVFQTIAEFQA